MSNQMQKTTEQLEAMKARVEKMPEGVTKQKMLKDLTAKLESKDVKK